MMSSPVAGIDPHQSSFTVAVVDTNGVEIAHASFANSGAGYIEAIELLSSHGVEQVGVEGSASWGSHVAIALVAAGFDAREVPPAAGRAAAASTTPGQDRQRRRGLDGAGVAGRAVARPGAGARGVRRVGRQDRSGARTPPDAGATAARWACITSLTSWPSCLPRSVTSSARRARSRPAWSGSASSAITAGGSLNTCRHLPPVVAAGGRRSGPPGARRDPPAGARAGPSARRARHHPARRARHRSDRRGNVGRRGR